MRAFLVNNRLFTFCIFIFSLHFILERCFGFHHLFFDNYLDPFLMMPVVLTLYLWEKPLLQKSGISLNPTEILLITLVVAVVAEFIFPKINSKCVCDFWDILGYSFGSCAYWIGSKYSPKQP
jgi:hypothetical protein